MSATFKLDSSRFDATLKQYLTHTSLTISQAINKKSLDLVIASGAQTKKASRDEIRAQLGPTASRIVAQRVRITKSGVKRGKSQSVSVLPPLLIALAIRRLGQGAKWDDIYKTALKIYAGRLRSVAFIKQGWIPAKEVLKRSDRGGDPVIGFEDKDLRRIGRLGASVQKGGADPAKRGFQPISKVWNWVTNSDKVSVGAYTVGMEALQRGFDKVTADMLTYIDRKMGKDARVFNAAQR